MSYLNPISMQETLNRIYKTEPVMKAEKRLVSDPRSRDTKRRGAREISYYRGDNYLNLITRRKDKNVDLIRTTTNIGTPDRPKMVTKAMLFILRGANLRIKYNKAGDSLKGVLATLEHVDFNEAYVKAFPNIAELRQDKKIMDVIWKVLKNSK